MLRVYSAWRLGRFTSLLVASYGTQASLWLVVQCFLKLRRGKIAWWPYKCTQYMNKRALGKMTLIQKCFWQSNKSYVSHLWSHWDYFQVDNDSQYIHICGCFAFFSCFGLFKTIKIVSCLLLLVIDMQVPVKISFLPISSYFFHPKVFLTKVLEERKCWGQDSCGFTFWLVQQ